MRLWIAGLVAAGMLPATSSIAAPKLTPAEIQATFFNGTEFVAATPSGVRFKMTFTADGKVVRVPTGNGGVRSQGSWRLNDSGYCTTWKGGKPSCFTVVAADGNKWSVMRGPAVIATWSK
ncbi:MAG: hypothetical protein J2P53_04845 [Bradyrhizobiaceae bacterium]|nr:hypothetical protein [Bradyrhizobiaceae bacterium]